jgi:hypothetical protein
MHIVENLVLASVLIRASVLACTKQSSTTVTFYGYPDNDPSGAGTACNCGDRNKVAGGSGSFHDPVTFATAREFKECEIIYIPYLKKYTRMEDSCEKWSKF